MSDGFLQIRLEVEDRIATITLDRPGRLNAFTPLMRDELVTALDTVDADDDVRVVIVTGAGRAFCAGADLGQRGDAPFSYARVDHRGEVDGAAADPIDGLPRDGGGVVALRLAEMTKPVIAAINGPAIGVGITMTLPMDMRVTEQGARFGFVFTRRGVAPEAASTWFLPRVVGIGQALLWALSGRTFEADEALSGGLVSEVAPAGGALDRARAIAVEIAENTSGVSVAVTRRLMWSMLDANSPWEAHRIETHMFAALKQGPDAAEGVASFLEKRPARYTASVRDGLPDVLPAWPQRPVATPEGEPRAHPIH